MSKRLTGDEYTSDSWLPCGEYNRESQPCDEYTMQPGVDFLVYMYLEQASEQANLGRLSGGGYTGESITNTNNFSNIRQNLNSFLSFLTGQGEIVWLKNQSNKISWYCPYKIKKVFIILF